MHSLEIFSRKVFSTDSKTDLVVRDYNGFVGGIILLFVTESFPFGRNAPVNTLYNNKSVYHSICQVQYRGCSLENL